MIEQPNAEGLVLRKLATIVALDLCLEHVEVIHTEYHQDYVKNFDKRIRTSARYKANKCQKSLDAAQTLRSELLKELKPTNVGLEMIQSTVEHYTGLFYDIISMEPKDQDSVKGLIKKLKKVRQIK